MLASCSCAVAATGSIPSQYKRRLQVKLKLIINMKFTTYLTACLAPQRSVSSSKSPAPPAYLINAIIEHSSQLSQQLQHQPEQPQELEVDATGGENMEEAAAPDHTVSCYVRPARLELPDYYKELPETPTSARDYSLAIDYTTSKTVCAVMSKCKDFIALGSQSTKDCVALLNSLETLLDILEKVQGTSDLDAYRITLEDTLVFASKAFAFLEKLCHKAGSVSSCWLPHKGEAPFNVFQCQFEHLALQLNEDYAEAARYASANQFQLCRSRRHDRPSFGVTTFIVATPNCEKLLYRKKRAVVPLIQAEDGTISYMVELTYPRTWRHKDVPIAAKIASDERGYPQTLEVDLLKVNKRSWGWQEQDTALITFLDLAVATVSSLSGSLLSFNRSRQTNHGYSSQPRFSNYSDHSTLKRKHEYRINVEIVGRAGIDPDLRRLHVVGIKEEDSVYYKCFANSQSEEVVAVYRFDRHRFHKSHGELHVVGRGNQAGLRHLIVSVFCSLGFTTTV